MVPYAAADCDILGNHAAIDRCAIADQEIKERITAEASVDEVREMVLDVDLPELDFEVGQSVGVLAPADPGTCPP